MHGHKICIIELEGTIFFGAADTLVKEIEDLLKNDIRYIILDFKRVNTIDISGEKKIKQIYQQVHKKGDSYFSVILSRAIHFGND